MSAGTRDLTFPASQELHYSISGEGKDAADPRKTRTSNPQGRGPEIPVE